MKTMFLKSVLSCIFSLLLTGCGLSIYEDWKASGGKAITGGGAIAGKDYVNGLLPSENSRKYFAKLSANSNQPIETVSRTDDNPSKSGVRFVKNGGIVIPSGVTISFTNEGYCMDPHLPAPVANEEYQLVPVSMLIPEDLQGTYKKLVRKASSGDENVKRNMQHLVWALRTAGTDAPYANNLTAEQKRILNRCSEYSGQFEEFNANAKANSKMLKELIGLADSFLNVKIGGVTYKASDLLDPDIGNKKINEHLNQLISMGKSLPVERSGFNYGELKKGVYTDIRGDGYLSFHAKIANSTNKEFIFYPTDYVGQVGSGTKSQGLTFFATANTSQRQRVTGGNPDKVEVDDQREPEKKDEEEKEEEYEWVCKMGCKDNCKAAQEALCKELGREYAWNNLKWELSRFTEGLSIGGNWLLGKIIKTKKMGGLVDARVKNAKTAIKSYEILGYTETTIDALEGNYLRATLGIASAVGVPYANDVSAVLDVAQASIDSYNEGITRQKEWETYRAEQWATFWKKHKKIKKKVKSK